jgi:tRNA 2-thiocytidine biosynthesis protein TtcA
MERLERRLLSEVARASDDHKLLEPGDRVMVGMSGGKDSYVMYHLLRELQRRAPFVFELIPVHLDQGHPQFPTHLLEDWLKLQGVPYRIIREHTYAIVKEKTPEGKAYCSMCSRLRRGILYTTAVEMGCTKIALGHHRDDSIETLMLNLLYSGQIKAMPPRLVSDDGRNTVIRPLMYCAEAEIAELARTLAFPVVPCSLCSEQPDLKRARVKQLIDELDAENPQVRRNLFAALGNVRPTHLLDRKLVAAVGELDRIGVDETIAALEGGGCAQA